MSWRDPDSVIKDLNPSADYYSQADLAASTPDAKVLAKAEASKKQKASTSGLAPNHVAKRTRSAMAQSSRSTSQPNLFVENSDDEESDDKEDACVKLHLITHICSTATIPTRGNQSGGSNPSAIEGKSIMSDAADALSRVNSSPLLLVLTMPPIWKMEFLLVPMRPDAGSLGMAGMRRLSAYVIKIRDMLEGVLVLSGLSRVWKSRVCDPLWAFMIFSAFLSGSMLRSSLAQSSGRTTRPSLFMGNSDDESDGDDDACVEIPLVTPIHYAAVIPSSRNQGGSFVAPAAEGPGTRGVSPPRLSSGTVPSFRDDAPYRPTFRVLTKEVVEVNLRRLLELDKSDLNDRICTLSKNDLKDLVKTYRIPLALHPHFPDPEFIMDRLHVDAIGIYPEFIWFSSPFSTFLLSVLRYFKMSIYYFMTLPSWSDAKIFEEPRHLSLPLLERVPLHTTAPATEGAIISLLTPYEIAASLPDSRLDKKLKGSSQTSRPSKKRKLQKRASEAGSSTPVLDQAEGADEADLADLCAEIEDSLKRDEGVSMRVISSPTPRLGKRLDAPPFIYVVSLLVVVLGSSRLKGEVMRRQMDPLDYLAHIALAREDEYDQILDDDFGTATHGVSSLLYTREEWNIPHAPESNISCKDIFKDLDLSNRVNVLSALLVSHGYALNSRYTNLVSSKARLQEKFDQKKGDVKLLHSEVTSLYDKLERLQGDYDVLGKENRELCSQRVAASEEVNILQS
nr:hypothetical protein [Tanacetum cinerariifolium]